ncbi:MAG: hypothetical protein OXB84_04150 [Halobacteriovoraceae bacterium]|nr:hypothetical protein [Halobacteriovoraceae bacterium]
MRSSKLKKRSYLHIADNSADKSQSSAADKKKILDYRKKINKMLKEEVYAKKAASIISELLKKRKNKK